MITITKPREIIDRKALLGKLEDLVSWSGYSSATQGDVLALFRAALEAGEAEVRRRFEEDGKSGSDVIRARAYLMDQLVRSIHDFAWQYAYPSANPTTGDAISVVATGGYGRGELAPYSDVDLMFLLSYKVTPHTEQIVEFALYTLWDLGLKVGHATRSITEALRLSKDDLTIRTSLLESRLITGDQALFNDFRGRFMAEVVKGSGPAFVEAKLAERDARHERLGDARYVLEPNLKDGKGGLRDLQTLYWIGKYLYRVDAVSELAAKGVLTPQDIRRFAKAENFLWTVRCHLHYLADRPEERLTFNIQSEIAERMGYTDHAGTRGVERFMKHYFLIAKDVGDLTRILCAVLEEQHAKRSRFRLPSFDFKRRAADGFRLDGNRLTLADDNLFEAEPIKLLQLFHEAQRLDVDVHPTALRLVTQNLKRVEKTLRRDPQANNLFMEMLTGRDPEVTLMRLNEAGVFGRFIPDFGRVIAQMQYDMYHVYTVDEHTIRAIGIVNGIETGRLVEDHPVACGIIREVQSRNALYLAVLLHDIAKGRGGDHSELGARVALKLAPRLGLSTWETETVSWLVMHHLLMSDTAFKRDLDDPKTVSDFVEIVQSPERLRLLLILTVADIRAVGPNVWNAWKAGLLRELYWRAQAYLTGGVSSDRRQQRIDASKAGLASALADWPEAEIAAHLARGTPEYWLSFDTDTLSYQARVVRDAEREKTPLHIDTRVDESRDATAITIYTADHPGLFAKIAGAMALSGADIVDAKIVTLANGMALDTFWIQRSGGEGSFDEDVRLQKLRKRIGDSLSSAINTLRELEKVRANTPAKRTGVFEVPPQVLIDNNASNQYTVIEINARNRIGLLYDLTRAITESGLQIASAHIASYGERAVDVFYVKDVFGLKVSHQGKLDDVRQRLANAIAPDGWAHEEYRAAKSPTLTKSTGPKATARATVRTTPSAAE